MLPSSELAGRVVARTLTELHWMGIVCGFVLLLATFFSGSGLRHPALARALVTLMLLLTATSQFIVLRRMEALHASMGAIDSVSTTDSRRVEFDRLHDYSTWLESGVLLSGLVMIYFAAEPPRSRMSAAGTRL